MQQRCGSYPKQYQSHTKYIKNNAIFICWIKHSDLSSADYKSVLRNDKIRYDRENKYNII